MRFSNRQNANLRNGRLLECCYVSAKDVWQAAFPNSTEYRNILRRFILARTKLEQAKA